MGGSDSVAYCRSSVQHPFEDLVNNGILVSVDDLLGYERLDEEFLTSYMPYWQYVGRLICSSARSIIIWKREMLWCGKLSLVKMLVTNPSTYRLYSTGAELQQLICGTTWMRSLIPGYVVIV